MYSPMRHQYASDSCPLLSDKMYEWRAWPYFVTLVVFARTTIIFRDITVSVTVWDKAKYFVVSLCKTCYFRSCWL